MVVEGVMEVEQLRWIHELQEWMRSPGMDAFFKGWANYIDTGYFYGAAIVLVWYLLDRRVGVRLVYLFYLSLLVSVGLKYGFGVPRPCQVDPSVGLMCLKSPGFPSTSAQIGTLIFGVVLVECKRWYYRLPAFVFAVIVYFSRVYLGVHYPTDILGGIVTGTLLVLVYWKVFPLFERIWKVSAVVFPFVLLGVGYLLPVSLEYVLDVFFLNVGLAAGLIGYARFGYGIERRWLQLASVLIGLGVLLGLKAAFPFLGMLWSFCAGYWGSFLGGRIVARKS